MTVQYWPYLALALAIGQFTACAAVATAQTTELPPSITEIRADISQGGMSTVMLGLTPCTAKAGYDKTRAVEGVWAADFVLDVAATAPWTLIVSIDGSERWRQALPSSIASGAAWQTPLFVGKSVRIQLTPPAGNTSPCPLVRHRELQRTVKSRPRGVFDRDDRWLLSSAELQKHANGKSIAGYATTTLKLFILDKAGQLLPCSGFMVSPHLLMTAAHCVADRPEAQRTALVAGGQTIPTENLSFLMAHHDLDFTLLWVSADTGVVPLVMATGGSPGPQQPLFLWQHPADWPNEVVSVVDCAVTELRETRLVHRCDSSGGTSGAPVQRADGRVVGLHVRGCKLFTGTPECINFATDMSSIAARVREKIDTLRAFFAPAADEAAMAFPPAT